MVDASIELFGVHKAFGDHQVLQDVSAAFPSGKLSFLLGLSGSGKSVMLKHILRLLPVDQGRIEVFGHDIATLSDRDMRTMLRRIGMVFQHSALFDSLSAGENVAFPLHESRPELNQEDLREAAHHWLRQVGLEEAYDRMPSELSGGMQRRVALARALATQPEVVLFDEPTTGLDPIMARIIRDLILETHARIGYTGVIITHNIEMALEMADHIAILVRGRIAFEGTAAKLRQTTDPILRQFLERRADGPIGVS